MGKYSGNKENNRQGEGKGKHKDKYKDKAKDGNDTIQDRDMNKTQEGKRGCWRRQEYIDVDKENKDKFKDANRNTCIISTMTYKGGNIGILRK